MLRIFKYPLKIEDSQLLELPKGSTILSAQNQREQLVLYVRVPDPAYDGTTKVKVLIRGTGHDASGTEKTQYLSTVMFHGGSLVYHVFIDLTYQEYNLQGISW